MHCRSSSANGTIVGLQAKGGDSVVQIKLDDAIASRLHELNYPVELCDPSGKSLGRFVPHFDPEEWELDGPDISDEELERCANSNERRDTTAEVLAHLKKLENT